MRILSMGMFALQALHARAEKFVVVPHVVLGAVRILVRPIRRGHFVGRARLEEREPFVETPLVEQRGFLEEEVLHLLTRDRLDHAFVPVTRSSQWRQNPRIRMRSSRASADSPAGASSHARTSVKSGRIGSSCRAASPSMSKRSRFGKMKRIRL